jgi:GTP cyclohydrolase I
MTDAEPLHAVPDVAGPIDRGRIEKAVREILVAIGEDPDRDGLLRTPARVAEMYAEICSGLNDDPARHLVVTFEAEHDEMVLVRDIALYSICEHHLIPFHGRAHVAYIPGDDGRITGLSKLARLVDGFDKRPQVPERLPTQLAAAIVGHRAPCFVMIVSICASMQAWGLTALRRARFSRKIRRPCEVCRVGPLGWPDGAGPAPEPASGRVFASLVAVTRRTVAERPPASAPGVSSITPDSPRGCFPDAAGNPHELAGAGAAVLDIGGESTRPGAAVDVSEELRRVAGREGARPPPASR